MILLYLRYKRMQKDAIFNGVTSEGDVEENTNRETAADIVRMEYNHENTEDNDVSEPQEDPSSITPMPPQYELNEELNNDDLTTHGNQGLWNAIKEEDDLVLKIVATAGKLLLLLTMD